MTIISHLTCSCYNPTLTLLPLWGGVYVPSSWIQVDSLITKCSIEWCWLTSKAMVEKNAASNHTHYNTHIGAERPWRKFKLSMPPCCEKAQATWRGQAWIQPTFPGEDPTHIQHQAQTRKKGDSRPYLSSYPQMRGHPSRGPRRHGGDTRHSIYALSEFLYYKTF